MRALLICLLLSACVTAPPVSRNLIVQPGGEDVNAFRRAARLVPLARSAAADRAAARHAADMNRNRFFAHKGSDGSNHGDRLRAVGCSYGAENIAYGTRYTQATVLDAWMESPGHRRNILNPAMRVYGLAQSGDRWVMVLAANC